MYIVWEESADRGGIGPNDAQRGSGYRLHWASSLQGSLCSLSHPALLKEPFMQTHTRYECSKLYYTYYEYQTHTLTSKWHRVTRRMGISLKLANPNFPNSTVYPGPCAQFLEKKGRNYLWQRKYVNNHKNVPYRKQSTPVYQLGVLPLWYQVRDQLNKLSLQLLRRNFKYDPVSVS